MLNKCYEYTDEDRIWRVTRTKGEKEMCERHKHNMFLAHGKEGKKVHGCGNECSCCERVEGSLSKTSLRNFFKFSLHPNILKNLIPILSIVNIPTADPSLERGRLKGHRETDTEVRGYSDDGKLKRMKYILFYFIIKYIRFHKIILLSFN